MLLQTLSGMGADVGNSGAMLGMPQPPKKKPPASAYALEKQCVDVEITKKHGEKHKKCSICCAKFKLHGDATMLAPCKHIFHDLCILQWLKQNNTCPLCRKELMTVDYDYESSKWGDKDQGNQNQSQFDPQNGSENDGGSGVSSNMSMYV